MSWFDQNELPIINSPDDLKKAMEVVKSRFNGYPHKYTRNDYLLLINTLYAALKYSGDTTDLQQNILNLFEDYSKSINNELRELEQFVDSSLRDYVLKEGFEKYQNDVIQEFNNLKTYIDNKEYPAKLQWEQLQ